MTGFADLSQAEQDAAALRVWVRLARAVRKARQSHWVRSEITDAICNAGPGPLSAEFKSYWRLPK